MGRGVPSRIATALGLLLIAAADAALAADIAADGDGDPVAEFFFAASLAGGLLVSRWWALALPLILLVALAALYEQIDEQELSFIGWLLFGAGLIAVLQALAIGTGVAVRRAVTALAARRRA